VPYINGGGSGGGVISGVTITGVGASGKVPVATNATAGTWAFPPGFEIGYAQITANTSITDTADATATALISPGALTFDGGAVLCTFYAPAITTDNAATADTVTVTLFEGATQICRLGTTRTAVIASPVQNAVCMMFRFTPTAASHTYKLCAFATSNSGANIVAGVAGTAAFAPAFIRFTKV
jgi:hypothetical protein